MSSAATALCHLTRAERLQAAPCEGAGYGLSWLQGIEYAFAQLLGDPHAASWEVRGISRPSWGVICGTWGAWGPCVLDSTACKHVYGLGMRWPELVSCSTRVRNWWRLPQGMGAGRQWPTTEKPGISPALVLQSESSQSLAVCCQSLLTGGA